MKKRLLSLLLALVMTVSLFTGLSMDAAADDVIANWINDKDVIKRVVDELYNEENVVYEGNCGDNLTGTNVLYKIYEVTNPYELEDTYLRQIFDQVFGDPDYDFESGVQYYGIRIYGSGAMKDYNHITDESPWSDKLTLKTGETVDMEEKLVVAYIEGASDGTNPAEKYTGVTSVGVDAFWGQDRLTAVFLGETITNIKEGAFETCDLLAAINMPDALTKIEDRAFYACDKLTFVRARATKITEIGERAFFSCTFLADVELPYTLKTIGKYAFAWDRILGTKNFIIPNSVTTIGEGAFAFCTHLRALTVPNSVTSIGPYAFLGAYVLEELTFTPADSAHPQPLTIGEGAFAANYSLPEVAFNRVQSIGVSAFGACESLQRVSFDDTINRVAERAFTSMISDVYTVTAIIAEIREVSDPSDEFDTVLQGLTGLTPLEEAAFSGDAPYVVEATEATRTFPDDCIVHYPEKNYTWDVTDDGKWKGYQTGYYWTGHFHEFEETTTAATCTVDGNIHRTCTVNGCGYEEDEAIPALGHDYVLEKAAAPTCTAGSANFYKCTRCGEIKAEAVEALGHDESNCVRVEPTCTTPGSVKGVCARCGAAIDRVIPPNGHNIIDGKVLKEATCVELGLEEGWCYDCGQYVQQAIPTTDHTLVTQPAVPATCTTAGKTAGSYCSVCGTVLKAQEVVPALGHNYVVTSRVEPTETTDGHVTYKCSRCGDSYSETLPRTVCAGDASCPGHNFTDMPSPSYWSHSAIDYCVTNGILYGVETTRFGCTEATTRGQLVTMLYRIQGSPDACVVGSDSVKLDKLRNPFTDNRSGEYYYNAVKWAYYNSIVAGTSATTFSPDDPITREQMATILYNYTLKYAPSGATGSATLNFPDAGSVSNYAVVPLQWAVANGIISGTQEGSTIYLDPQGTATREQVASILMRYQLNIAKK